MTEDSKDPNGSKPTDASFGGESSVKALELLRTYRKLSEKKNAGLSPDEEKTLKHIETLLGKALDKKASPTQIEQRKAIRVTNRIEINLESAHEVKKAYIKNISGGGLYLETNRFQPIGTILTVHLTLPGSDKPEPVDCQVAWVNPKNMPDLAMGMGLKFHKIDDKTRTRIQRLVDSIVESEIQKKVATPDKKEDPKKK